MVLPQIARRALVLAQQNQSSILTALGMAGTVSTAVLTGRSTVKAVRVVDSKKDELAKRYEAGEQSPEVQKYFFDGLSRTDQFKLVWPLYIPPTITGITTIMAIFMAHRVDARKIAALAMASSVSERALLEYKEKIAEKFTVGQSTKVRDEIAQDRVNKNPPSASNPSGSIIIAGGEVLCYDMATDRYFYSTVEDIKKAVNEINHDINDQMGASLAEFHERIGLRSTPYTESVGWNSGDLIDVQISAVTTPDNKPALAIDFNYPPTNGYRQSH